MPSSSTSFPDLVSCLPPLSPSLPRWLRAFLVAPRIASSARLWVPLLAVAIVLLSACSQGPKDINLGQTAPTFTAVDLAGRKIQLPAGAAGRPIVLHFWADWCNYCEPELRDMEPIYQDLRTRGLEIYAINAGQDRETTAALVRKVGATYPTLLDENSAIVDAYGVVGLPTTFFIDGKGVVRGKLTGGADAAVFRRQAEALLGSP